MKRRAHMGSALCPATRVLDVPARRGQHGASSCYICSRSCAFSFAMCLRLTSAVVLRLRRMLLLRLISYLVDELAASTLLVIVLGIQYHSVCRLQLHWLCDHSSCIAAGVRCPPAGEFGDCACTQAAVLAAVSQLMSCAPPAAGTQSSRSLKPSIEGWSPHAAGTAMGGRYGRECTAVASPSHWVCTASNSPSNLSFSCIDRP